MKLDFKAAIFDMDGTLLNTMPYWRLTMLEYVLHHQLPILQDMVEVMFHTSSRGLIKKNARRLGIENLDYDAMVHEMEGYMNRHYLYDANLKEPGVPAFLDLLRERGVRMCVATGSPREYACNGLRRLGIIDYFDFVTDNYEIPLRKEQPEYFVAQSERLGVAVSDCVVFEDALYAMRSAKAAGMRVCAIEDDTQSADKPEIMALADWYIHAYRDLVDS